MGTDYRKKAEELLGGGYAKQKTALDMQKSAVEQQYAKNIEDNTRNGALSQNLVANNSLGRGMGRSTIVTGQLAAEQGKTNRLATEIGQNRDMSMNNIEMQRTAMESDYQSNVAQMMDQLQQRDIQNYRASQASNSKANTEAALRATWNEFYKAYDNNNSFEFVERNRENIVDQFGEKVYEVMLERAGNNKYKEDKVKVAKTNNSKPMDFEPVF